MSPAAADGPRERHETVRQALRRRLEEENRAQTALELSSLVGTPEREVITHLEHLARSLQQSPLRLEVTPAECLACGFVFERRQRLSRPGACPRCREGHIAAPAFQIR